MFRSVNQVSWKRAIGEYFILSNIFVSLYLDISEINSEYIEYLQLNVVKNMKEKKKKKNISNERYREDQSSIEKIIISLIYFHNDFDKNFWIFTKKKKYLEFLRHKYHYIIRDEVKKYFFDSFTLLICNFTQLLFYYIFYFSSKSFIDIFFLFKITLTKINIFLLFFRQGYISFSIINTFFFIIHS